jgi:sigma-B regulation protein RsbU (phosphoserine phosphatase)
MVAAFGSLNRIFIMSETASRLLVVDDDENNRDMLSRRLERKGYSVAQAPEGQSALTAVGRETFDLVLLDIEMPEMNGFEVLKRVRETHPATRLPIIIATARGDREDVVEALRLGANDYVTKPLDFPVVAARVEAQLSLKRAVDRIVALEAALRRHNVELEQANNRMRQSLDLASQMQRSLLPVVPMNLGEAEFEWVFHPCDELGGDILNVFPLGKRHAGIYLLDVSGHGVPAALLSVTLSRILAPLSDQSSLVEKRVDGSLTPRPPCEVAQDLNRRFPMSGGSLQYFTMFYGVFDLEKRVLKYVSAGHPPALHVSAAGQAKFLEGQNCAIGWFPEAVFEEGAVTLQPGDRLFVYSDGITETMDASGVIFGSEKLSIACCEDRKNELSYNLRQILETVGRYRGSTPIMDDLSALALQIKPGPSTQLQLERGGERCQAF